MRPEVCVYCVVLIVLLYSVVWCTVFRLSLYRRLPVLLWSARCTLGDGNTLGMVADCTQGNSATAPPPPLLHCALSGKRRHTVGTSAAM